MRRFVSYPHIVSTLALLVALSGGAYAAGLVGTSDLKNGAVTTKKIRDHAVSPVKLSGGAHRLITRTAAKVAPLTMEFANNSIQQVGSSSLDLGTFTFPEAGTYLVTGSLRAFPRASNPGHNLNCSFSDGATGVSITNVFLEDNQVLQIPMTGLIQIGAAGTSVPLSCRQIFGSGEATVSYELDIVRVVSGLPD